jgi:hypothetical protein
VAGNLVVWVELFVTRGGYDFGVFVAAARALQSGAHDIYSSVALAHGYAAFSGRPEAVGALPAYLNAPLAALLLVPLADLPPLAAQALFAALSLGAIAGGCWILVARLRAPRLPVLLAACSVPAAIGVGLGQWDGLLLLALTAAFWQLDRRPFLAGLLLAVLLLKPQTVWLVPFVLLVTGRWRALGGFVAGAAVWVGSDLALLGSDWLAWPRAMLEGGTAQMSGAGTQEVSLSSIVASAAGPGAGYGLALAAAAGLVLGAVAVRSRLTDPLAIASAVCASLLLAPHVTQGDMLLLTPAIALVGRRRPGVAVGLAAILSVAFVPADWIRAVMPSGGPLAARPVLYVAAAVPLAATFVVAVLPTLRAPPATAARG